MAQFSRYYTYVEPLVKTPKSKAYSMLILSIFAIAFFGFFAIRPTLTTIINLQKQISEAEKVDEQLSKKIRALADAQDILARLSPKLYLIQEALPTNPNLATLLRSLEVRAQAAKVAMGSIQVNSVTFPGEEAAFATGSAVQAAETTIPSGAPVKTAPSKAGTPSVTEIKFVFTISGSDQAVIDFLHRFYDMRRIAVIDSLRAITREGESSTIVEVNARTYQKL